ncbi:MAG: hypothetical protein JEY99_17625 [Spirochaetales bacterium]|nr:hypothetical protein [Spirochaetales bacterium]
MKRVVWILPILILTFLFSGCETFTIRSSPEAFRSGRVLKEGETKVLTNSTLISLIPMPGLEWSVTRGLPYNMEVTAGWGVHALVYAAGDDAENESDTYHGPEIFISKNLLNLNNIFYLAGTVGAEMNVIPVVDAAFHGGVDFGFYPIHWFTIFGHAKALYHTAGYFSPQLGLGFGFDSPFVLKIAAYTHLHEDMTELPDNTYFGPLYYGIQIGFRIKDSD